MAEPPPRDPHEPAEDETIIRDEWGPEETVVAPAGATREEVVEEAPPPRRLPELWPWLLALLLVVAGIIAAVVLLGGDDDDETATTTTTTETRLVSVPDVVGDTEDEARASLEAAGFEVRTENVPSDAPEGSVVAQDPAGGEEAEEGTAVRINLAEAPDETVPATTAEPPATTEAPPATTETQPPPTTTEPEPEPEPQPAAVPDVVGQPLADAARAFGDERLQLSVVYVPSEEPLGTVVAQAQQPGTELEAGDTVQVNVSPGPDGGPQANVPDVVGRTLDDARGALERARLEVLVVQLGDGESDEVSRQSPSAGARVPRGSLVVLYARA